MGGPALKNDVKEPFIPCSTVPAAVLEATRALLWVRSAADAHRAAEELVTALGCSVVSAAADHPDAIPADLSFGDGDPVLPAAPAGSSEREELEVHLWRFLLDARRAIELASRTERLAEAATTDLLTGLSNRRMISRALGHLEYDDIVVVIDLDHFKEINDTLGHAMGDTVLRDFGATLQSTARARDIVGRFGGEEFLIILTPPMGADTFLHRLRAEWTLRRPVPVTFSAGIAQVGHQPDQVVARADAAMYEAKSAGRDRWQWARSAGAPSPSDGVTGAEAGH